MQIVFDLRYISQSVLKGWSLEEHIYDLDPCEE